MQPDVLPSLIFLSHRIPYPPDKGDKIRSWNLIRALASSYRIFLVTFIDDKRDFIYTQVLEDVCESCLFISLSRLDIARRAIPGFLQNTAISVSSYSDKRVLRQVQYWLDNESVEHMLVFSGAVAKIPLPNAKRPKRLIVDFVDADSEKWHAYADRRSGLSRWFYKREAELLARHERAVCASADVSVLVSDAEAALFKRVVNVPHADVRAIGNGVDHRYFSIDIDRKSPYDPDQKVVIFTGEMDYLPNVDAVCWFAVNVLPLLRNESNHLHFAIVGRNPVRKVRELAEIDGCIVTGTVDDVRPWLQHSFAAVAPMHVARGVQNKVLEAMSMAKVVVASSCAIEGIEAIPGTHCIVAEDPTQYAAELKLVAASSSSSKEMELAARRFVVDHFDWSVRLEPFIQLMNAD